MYHMLEAWKNLNKETGLGVYVYMFYVCLYIYIYICICVCIVLYVRKHACILVTLRVTKRNNKTKSTQCPQTALMRFYGSQDKP